LGYTPGSFVKSVKTQELEDTELGRMYGKLEVEMRVYPLSHAFGKDVILLELRGGGLLRM
jgi:hypothetical protein